MKKLSCLLLIILCSCLFAPAQEPAGGDFSDESIQYDFAMGLLRRGLAQDAATEFDRFIKQFPKSPKINDALLQRAQSNFTAGDFQKAANDYYAWINRTRSADQQIRLRYAICLYELGNFKNALAVLSTLKSDDTVNAVAYYSGLCLQKSGKLTDAIASLQKITSGDLHAPALFARAQCLQELKDNAAAAELYGLIVKTYPTHDLAEKSRLARANALRLAGKLDQSTHGFDELAKSDDQNVRERALYGLAWTKLENGKLNDALQTAGQIQQIVKDPQLKTGTHYLLGMVYFRKNDYPKAIAEYRQSMSGEFADKSALGLGWALYKLNDFPAALKELARINKQAPAELRGEADYLAGRCYWGNKDFDKAAQAFASSAKLSSTRTEQATYEQALSLEKANKPADAAVVYESLLQKFPKSKMTVQILSAMGRALLTAQRYEAAIIIYTRLLAVKDLSTDEKQSALERQAVSYYYLKQYKNMSRAYLQLLKEFPKGQGAQSALYWLGWYELQRKNFPAAINHYNRLLKDFPNSRFTARSQYYLGSAYLRAGKDKEAAELFYTLSGQKDNPLEERELLWLGKFLQENGQLKKAQDVYQRITGSTGNMVMQSLALRGMALSYQQQKNWQKSLETFNKLFLTSAKINGQPASAQAFANEALLGAAIALRHQNKLDDAHKKLQALNISADDPFMARVILEKGQLAYAQKDYNQATALLMRVGLLVADEQLAGEALWLAAQSCEKNSDMRKAHVCYDELAGKTKGSYGRLYKNSLYRTKALKRLKELDAEAKKAAPSSAK